jgi:hypothetical protein
MIARRVWPKGRLLVAAAALTSLASIAAEDEGGEPDFELVRGPPRTPVLEDATPDDLEGGRELFRRARAGDFISAFTNERFENLARPEQLQLFQDEGRFEDLFLDGDEAFEFEPDRTMGAGYSRSSRAFVPPPLPLAGSPVHEGNHGGSDGASCRACHFVGGPDGAGSSTQRALFRGDGRFLSSAVVRDAPHVMGLGYISRIAREMEAELLVTLLEAEDLAVTTVIPLSLPLVAKGIGFGELVARPGGVVDRSRVDGVSPDLIIRPFGRKGRHADLPTLIDEALQVHQGMQSASRVRDFLGRTDVLGEGPPSDPDGDGVVASLLLQDGQEGAEASYAQATLMAGYLSLLGVPEVHPPQRADLLVSWTRGRELLDEVGCTLCHVEKLVLNSDIVEVKARGGYDLTLSFSLQESGQETRAVRTDDGVSAGPGGRTPIFPYTDLKRHFLGEALAEAVDEELPDGADVIPGSVWLTRSLWGLADTAPYMPDGRAATVHDAIVLHGGEAAGMRDAYLALKDTDQAALRAFLLSLTRGGTVLVE